MPVDVKVIPAAKNVFPNEPASVRAINGLLHDLEKIAVFSADIDITGMRADGEACNDYTFNYGVGVMFENQAVFAGSGLALITITKNVFWPGRLLGNKRPFE